MIFSIKAKANSKKNALLKENGQVIVRIHAPAQEGKANKAIIEFLSATFGVPKSFIEIVGGATSPFKRVSIADEYKDHVERVLANL
jgi:uncharacterized protein (TIGR00251 family)